MRIAIASDDGTRIAAHTGRCGYLVVFEVADGQAMRLDCRANSFTPHARGECTGGAQPGSPHAHHTHGSLIDAVADCCALITRGLGPRLVADLAQRGIDAFVCAAETVEEAAQQFAQGRLQRVTGTGCSEHH
jgi:predicted Fe-Mo cluster-binding NifX family protein